MMIPIRFSLIAFSSALGRFHPIEMYVYAA